MGSYMAHLNYFHTRVAGFNFCFFIAVPSGCGCWYCAKCEMLLCKIDGEMNMQNCGYFAKLLNGDGGVMLHDRWQWQLPWSHAVVFKEMTHCRHQKHRWRCPCNPNSRSKFRKYRVYLLILHLFTSTRLRLLRCHFSKTWHIADVKNITGDD